jgi:DNA-binding response OmpR family regulator
MTQGPPAADAVARMERRLRTGLDVTVDAVRQLERRLRSGVAPVGVLDDVSREMQRVRGLAGNFGLSDVDAAAALVERHADSGAGDLGTRVRGCLTALQALARALYDIITPPAPEAAERLRAVNQLGYRLVAVGCDAWAPALVAGAERRSWQYHALPPGAPFDAIRDLAPTVLVGAGAPEPALAAAAHALGVPLILITDHVNLPAGASASVPPESAGRAIDLAEVLRTPPGEPESEIVILPMDPAVAGALATQLEADGHRVHVAPDAAAVPFVFDIVAPEIVLVDGEVPSAVEGLRHAPGGAPPAVIAVMDGPDAGRRSAVLAAGADLCIVRPFLSAELQRVVRVIRRRGGVARGTTGTFRRVIAPEDERVTIDGPPAVDAARRDGATATLAVVRRAPTPGGATNAAWYRQLRRLTRTLASSARIVGTYQSDNLVVLVHESVPEAQRRFSVLASRRRPEVPPWAVGFVALDSFPREGFAELVEHAANAADDAIQAGEPAMVAAVPSAPLAPDVILVDGARDDARMLRYALEMDGLSVTHFTDGQTALEALLAYRTEPGRRPVVVTEVTLPALDGLALLDRLAAERPRTYVGAVVTFNGAEHNQMRALRSGAIDYVVRPYAPRLLAMKARGWVELGRGQL